MINNNFSDESKNILRIAESYSKDSMSEAIEPAHLLKAVLHKEAGLIDFLEKDINKDYYYLLDWANMRLKLLPKSSTPNFEHSLSDASLAVFKQAENYRESTDHAQLERWVYIRAVANTHAVCR